MRRNNKHDDYKISLFPMFNILICILGSLIFILGAVTALSLGLDKSMTIAACTSGSSCGNSSISKHNKTPHYLEWDGVNLIAHPRQHTVALVNDIEEIGDYLEVYSYINEAIADTPIEEMLEFIADNSETDYVVVLFRPSGFSTESKIRGYIGSWNIDLGYEPIEQDWNIKIR